LKQLLFIVGFLLILAGALFAAQGSGIFPYPRESFMISQTPWIYRGIAIAACGVLLAAVSRGL
jgi:hypothetical protein